ncbi:hypothetical protein ScPMuIL_013490 [Solemya velum]
MQTRMDEKHKMVLQVLRGFIVKNLRFLMGIINILFLKEVLCEEERDTILVEDVLQAQIERLLDILLWKGENAFPSFIEALKETGNEHIVKELEQQGEGASCSPTNDVTQCRAVVQNVTGDRNIFAGPGATQNITVTGENKTCILIEEATSEVKPEVESKKVSAGEEEREKSTKEKVTPKDEPCEHKSQEHSDEQKDSCEDNYKPESEAEVKDTSKADENRKNKTEEAKRKKNEAADRKNYENQVESKVVEPPSEQIEIQGGTQLKSLRAKPDEVEDEATPATTIVISPDGVMRGACNVIENVQTGGNIARIKLGELFLKGHNPYILSQS